MVIYFAFLTGPLDCEFEVASSPKCHWKDVNGKGNFIRNSGGTPSSSTGPTGDISQNLSGGIDEYFMISHCQGNAKLEHNGGFRAQLGIFIGTRSVK